MLMRLRTVLVAIALSAIPLTPALAVQVTLSFAVTGFGPTGAPTDPVIGSLSYDAASITSDLTSLTAVDLTIDGHAYTLAELGFGSGVIGGIVNGVNTVTNGFDDFFVGWNPVSATPLAFDYATTDVPGIFESADFTEFNFRAATPAPEPSTWAALLVGFAGLGFLGYHSSRKAASIAT
jgi:hypothetical protein